MKILVAEDEVINRMYIGSLLRKRHWAYDEVSDGRAALDAARTGAYDIILLDLGLPGKSGREIAEILHREQNPASIIIVSGYLDTGDLESFNEIDVSGFVAKPIQEYVFYQQIEEIISRGNISKE